MSLSFFGLLREAKHFRFPLVTQPMLQCRPNRTELRLMDSCIQILCRFQKNKQKVPLLSPLSTQKPPFALFNDEKNLPWG